MTRRYGDVAQVRSVPGARGEPVGFCTRGRSYLVRTVLARWVETGPWWSGMDAPTEAGGLPVLERTVWRVEAVPGRTGAGSSAISVHDLVQESVPGHPPRWWLARTLD